MGSKQGISHEACGILLAAWHQGNSAQLFSLPVNVRTAKDDEVTEIFGQLGCIVRPSVTA